MLQQFEPGDFLIFQLESGYALLRVLDVEGPDSDPIWHLASFNEFFMDPDQADAAISSPGSLTIGTPHIAMTNHAFESTQVARMGNAPLTDSDKEPLQQWRSDSRHEIHDRSIRLLLGLR